MIDTNYDDNGSYTDIDDYPSVEKCEYCLCSWCDSNEPVSRVSKEDSTGESHIFCCEEHFQHFKKEMRDEFTWIEPEVIDGNNC